MNKTFAFFLSTFLAGASCAGNGKLAKELADDPDVASISPDRSVAATAEQSMATIGAEIACTYGYDGTGIGFAVINSGIRQTSDTTLKNGSHGRLGFDRGMGSSTSANNAGTSSLNASTAISSPEAINIAIYGDKWRRSSRYEGEGAEREELRLMCC